MEMLSTFNSLNVEYEYIKCNVGQENNLQINILAAVDFKFSFLELNSLLQNWYDTPDIKKYDIFSKNITLCNTNYTFVNTTTSIIITTTTTKTKTTTPEKI